MKLNTFVRFLITVDVRPFMLVLGFFTAVWGVWLLNPLANTLSVSRAYMAMRMLAPEMIWGGTFFLAGLAQIAHAMLPLRQGAMLVTAISVFLWVFVFVTLLFSSPYSTAVPVYAQVAVWNIWMLYRIKEQKVRNGLD